MNGIIFWENGEVQVIGALATVRLIAMKVQEVIPQLVQQERDAILQSLSDVEMRSINDRLQHEQQQV